MKNFYRLYAGLCCAGLFLCVASLTSAADMTWTGKISDSMCGASHAGMGTKMSDHDCTVGCVKAGAKYVFVSKGRSTRSQTRRTRTCRCTRERPCCLPAA